MNISNRSVVPWNDSRTKPVVYHCVKAACVLSGVMAFLFGFCIHAQGITAEDKEQLITYHNEVRNEVGVGPVSWSDEAAALAQKWADHLAATGEFKHNEQKGNFGENIAINSSVLGGAKAWYSEIKDYRPGAKIGEPGAQFEIVGHYTQMIWNSTEKIGAGVAVMSKGDFIGQVVLVCNYAPPGNYLGEIPYGPGAKATMSTLPQPVVPAPAAQQTQDPAPLPPPAAPAAGEPDAFGEKFELTSTALVNGAEIPVKYTGEGDDISPPLAWKGAPAGTKSFFLGCEDLDAPSAANPNPDGPFVHWLILNIPADTKDLPADVPRQEKLTRPAGATQGRNGFDEIGYAGPMPPKGSGRHRYVFTIHAMDRVHVPDPNVTPVEFLQILKDSILATAQLTGTYEVP
jgi:Raf kinase inhibitor-like YbhB/YbcL family protein